jgi:polyisoprenoid-binding protein YceI
MRPPDRHHPAAAASLALLLGGLAVLGAVAAWAADDAGPALVPAATPVEFSVRPGSSVSYHLDHTLHDVTGVSKALEGTARLLPGGTVEVLIRVRVDSFDSGNGSRDAKMLEVTEAARFPFVLLKAAGGFRPPASHPATLDLDLTGELTFHGITRPVSVPVRVTFSGPAAARATATFPFSPKEFEVVPPKLLFMVIKDRAAITATVALEAAPP